ncbi:hypothetical protein [Methanothrix soehngenii]
MLDESVIQMIQLIGALLFGTIIGWYVYLVKRRQRTHAASGGASEALPHEVGARPSRSEPKLNTHALYPSRSELRGITFKNKSV